MVQTGGIKSGFELKDNFVRLSEIILIPSIFSR